jgi:DNA polymerase
MLSNDVIERKMIALKPLADLCHVCPMCELGFRPAKRGEEQHDPHVFSNLNPSKFVVVGQNPGWNEVVRGEPFVGDAGQAFDSEIAKHGLSRDDFYICNVVRCFTPYNTKPTHNNLQQCEPFLRMELGILKPQLIIALGSVAFEQLCPDKNFSDSLLKLTKSKYNVPVFPIYHPSPLNLDEGGRRSAFAEQIRLMCGLVKAIKSSPDRSRGL